MYCKLVFDVPLDRDFDYAVPEELASQVKPGVRVTAPFGRMLTTGLVVSVSTHTALQKNIVIKKIACVLDEKPLFGSDLFSLATFMKKTWGGAIGQILFALVPPQAYFKLTAPSPLAPYAPHLPAEKKENQALLQLTNHLQQGFKRLVWTGTDSTTQNQLLLSLLDRVLRDYGQVLITMPDVLAAQRLTQQLEKYFGTEWVLGWHSKMLLSQKKKIFSHISQGKPGIIVAARSGGLLPFKNLRLAVMLEEENNNYKQEENKPYFHLRDLLAYRCRQHQALFITASDTPSLETMYAVAKTEAEEMTFTDSSIQKKLPVKITTKKGEKSALLSDILYNQLQENIEQKQASLLIFNRRGYAQTYFCLNCGAYAKCKECGAILSHEKKADGQSFLRCTKCGHTEPMEQTCPKCQNKIFKSRGGGTQKIIAEVTKLFPMARVLRLDSDTLKNKEGQGYLVRQALDAGAADIVVGTHQALEASLSPRVNLVALVDADLELDSPDFRASEQLGQLLFKLKNRLLGRPNPRLIIQASSGDIYPFEMLQETYNSCAQEELTARKHFGYPPYVKLIKVLLKSKDPVLLEAEMARVMSAGAAFATHILGPVQTGKKTDILKKQYLLFKTTPAQYPHLLKALDTFTPSKKTEIKVFADPYNFY